MFKLKHFFQLYIAVLIASTPYAVSQAQFFDPPIPPIPPAEITNFPTLTDLTSMGIDTAGIAAGVRRQPPSYNLEDALKDGLDRARDVINELAVDSPGVVPSQDASVPSSLYEQFWTIPQPDLGVLQLPDPADPLMNMGAIFNSLNATGTSALAPSSGFDVIDPTTNANPYRPFGTLSLEPYSPPTDFSFDPSSLEPFTQPDSFYVEPYSIPNTLPTWP